MKNLHLLIAASLVNLVFIVGIVLFVPKQVPVVENRPSPSPAAPIATPTRQVIHKTVVITATPIPKPSVAATANNNSVPDNRCIVTVDGVRYNVTQFRQDHSGGDIFVCGTDMTQTFWSQHNQKVLDQMVKYKI